MTDTTSKRTDRFPAPLRVHYSFDRVEGTATLVNISYTGALLQDPAPRPEIGTPVTLFLFLQQPRAFKAELPSELPGVVVRHGSGGFAVRFKDNLDSDVRELVDYAAALVGTRRRGSPVTNEPD